MLKKNSWIAVLMLSLGLAGCSGNTSGGECPNECTGAGELRCSGDVLQVCEEGPDGCLVWQDEHDCAEDSHVCQIVDDRAQCFCQPSCSGKACGSDGCGGNCPPGCQDDEVCSAEGQCESDCQDACEPTGFPACEGVYLQDCTLQGDGCYHIVSVDCPDGEVCQGEATLARCAPDLPQPTHLFALPKGLGQVHLGWRLVSSHPELGYNAYRSTTPGGPYEKLNVEPISDQTNFRDTTVTNGIEYFYVVRIVDEIGQEGPDSLEARVVAAETDNGEYIHFTGFNPDPGVDDWCDIKFGDVDGDGLPEFLQACLDTEVQDWTFDVAVFDREGNCLWIREEISDKVGSGLPWTFVDLDLDGNEDVVGVVYDKAVNDIRAVALDGRTGVEILRSEPIAVDPNQCGGHSNLSLAMLDGQSWSVVVQTCIYNNHTRTVTALDSSLRIQWQYVLDANVLPGGAYAVLGADVDGDGEDEVLVNGSVLESDGSLAHVYLWETVSGIRVGDIRPDLPGLEIFYFNKDRNDPEAVLSTMTGMLWQKNQSIQVTCEYCGHVFSDDVRRGHHGWIGDVDESPGMECFAAYYWNPLCPVCNKRSSTQWVYRLYSSTGAVLGTHNLNDPIDWDGQLPLENMAVPGTGKRMFYAADVIGDFREEFIVMLGTDPITPPYGLLVVTNTSMLEPGVKAPSPWEKREYVIDKRWTGYR